VAWTSKASSTSWRWTTIPFFQGIVGGIFSSAFSIVRAAGVSLDETYGDCRLRLNSDMYSLLVLSLLLPVPFLLDVANSKVAIWLTYQCTTRRCLLMRHSQNISCESSWIQTGLDKQAIVQASLVRT
jgi:hypothetical protein